MKTMINSSASSSVPFSSGALNMGTVCALMDDQKPFPVVVEFSSSNMIDLT